MRLTRIEEPFSYGGPNGPVVGHRGLLVIGTGWWPTVERWDVDTKLTPDAYDCEFGWWTDRSGRRWKAIRVLLTTIQFERIYPEKRQLELIRSVGERRARGRIYIHSANWPHELEGCIAPGRERIHNGVGRSREALLEVFEALGGWEEDKRFSLEVA